MLGVDKEDKFSTTQGRVRIPDISELELIKSSSTPLKGLKIGMYSQWFNHADPSIVRACQNTVEYLEKMGAEIVEITIPLLEEMKLAQLITIGSEMAAAMHPYYNEHGYR